MPGGLSRLRPLIDYATIIYRLRYIVNKYFEFSDYFLQRKTATEAAILFVFNFCTIRYKNYVQLQSQKNMMSLISFLSFDQTT